MCQPNSGGVSPAALLIALFIGDFLSSIRPSLKRLQTAVAGGRIGRAIDRAAGDHLRGGVCLTRRVLEASAIDGVAAVAPHVAIYRILVGDGPVAERVLLVQQALDVGAGRAEIPRRRDRTATRLFLPNAPKR